MLGDVCSVPDCNMPLMRSPDKSQKIMCVICDTKPAQSAKKEEPMKANTVPSVASTPSEVDVSTKSKEIATKPSPASQDPSDILGDYLLRGWVMMNDACPDCHVSLPWKITTAQTDDGFTVANHAQKRS